MNPSIDRTALRQCRLLMISLVTAVTLAALVSPASGNSGLNVNVQLYFSPDPAISEHLNGQIKRQVERSLATMLGNGANIAFPKIEAVEKWIRTHSLSELSAQKCIDLGCDQSDKTIFLYVAFVRGTFQICAVEFDRHFRCVGEKNNATLVQREMVPDGAARLALQCWTPVGRINSRQSGRDFLIAFTNQARLMQVPNWSHLKKNAVLQLYRQSEYLSSPEPQQHPSMFFRIKTISSTAAIATPLDEAWDEQWFSLLGDPRSDYLVRRVIPVLGKSTVQVLLSGKVDGDPDLLVPRGGCDVYVHDQPTLNVKLASKISAVTNRHGIAIVEVSERKPMFVTVLYGDQSLTHGLVRGVTAEPLPFQFKFMGNQTDFLNSLKWIQDKLRANRALINDRTNQVNATAKKGDAAEIAALGNEAVDFTNVETLTKTIDSIEKEARTQKIDIGKDLKSTRAMVAELRKSGTALKSQMEKATKFSGQEKRLEVIQDLFYDRKWDETLVAWKQFAKDFPSHPQSAKLDAFRAFAEPKDNSHRDARKLILDAGSVAKMNALAQRWASIRDAIDLLIKHDDILYLVDTQENTKKWEAVLAAEKVSLFEDNERGTQLPPTERSAMVQQLLTRKKSLETVNGELKSRSEAVSKAANRSKDLL